MRTFPVIANGIYRVTDREMNLDGFWIPKGQSICIPFLPIMNDPIISGFERADEFWPERWLPEGGAPVPGEASFMPFSLGPRDCIGQSLALLEARTLLATVMHRFVFRKVPGQPAVSVRVGLTLSSATGIYLYAIPRRASG